MEQQNFQRLMTYLAAAYSTEVSKDRAAVYWHQLGALPDKPFELAVHQHVGHSSRFPTVAELRHATRTQMVRYEPKPVVRRINAKRSDPKTAHSHLRVLRRKLRGGK